MLEAASDVHAVPDHPVFKPPCITDVASDNRPEVKTDSYAHGDQPGDATLGVPALERADHIQRAGKRAKRVVIRRFWCAEGRHQAVANVLVQGPTVVKDRLSKPVVVLAKKRDDIPWWGRLAQ